VTSLPTSMRVVEISEPGGPNVLKLARREVPAPGPGQILIRNEFAGVNRPDILQRSGAYDPPHGASDLPGLESAGVVVAVGKDVSRWNVGDRVCALLPGGGYAEYSLTHQNHALPIPAQLDSREAAAICETHFTVWSNVFERGRLRTGESFLVHGGSSGIGSTAIQLACYFGAQVFATAGTDRKCDFCRHLGADVAINYRTEDFVEVVKTHTDGRGVNVVLDMVGGPYLPRNIRALANDGRLVQIAFIAGSKVNLNFAQVMFRRLTITGSTLRPQSDLAKSSIAGKLYERVWPLFRQRSIAPVIDSVYDLEDAADAHRVMEKSQHMGKLVLRI